MNWQEIPLVRLLAPYAAGILLGRYLPQSVPGDWLPLVLIAGVILLWRFRSRPLPFRRRLWFGAGSSAMLLLLGALAITRQPSLRQPAHFSHHWSPGAAVLATVRTGASGESQSWGKALVDVIAVEGEGAAWEPVTGRLLTYHRQMRPQRGDTLLLRCRIDPIPAPLNPRAFDYAQYMANRGVFHQAFPRPGQVSHWPYRGRPGLRHRAEQLRRLGLKRMKRHLNRRETFAVGAALVLGYREALDEDLRDAYARSGAIHILAVSGLHVGLVYLALSFVLRFLPVGDRRWKAVRLFVQLTGIWGFVLVAGLPPSAVRAAAMFSFFSAGRTLSRDASVYNILAAAAFCMLIVDPRLLFDVGFQLSFAAVFGIVSWQGGIYRSLYFPYAIPGYLWKLTSVSVAAQLATFPLSLYYFHQFPLLFWLSGLIAIPAASLILGGGLSLLLLSDVPWLGHANGWALNELINGVNACIAWIAGLPGSRLSGLWIEGWVVGLWYALILTVVLAFQRRRGRYWLVALSLLFFLLVYRAGRRWSAVVQRQLVVYAVAGHTLIDLFYGPGGITIADSLLEQRREDYAAANYRAYRNISEREAYPIGTTVRNRYCRYENGLLQFYQFRLLIVGPETAPEWLPDIKVNAVLIRGDPRRPPDRLLPFLQCDRVIIDASCTPQTAKRWKKHCEERRLPVHDLRRSGAFVFDLNRNSTIYL